MYIIIRNIKKARAVQRKFFKLIDENLVKICSSHPFLSSLYYLLFSRQFDREHQAVLKGRLKYKLSEKKPGHSSILLRRNIHRLEKGLIMRPQRALFAANYIEETIICFETCCNISSFEKDELQWARDVLYKYFNTIEMTDKIQGLFERYKSINKDKPISEQDKCAAPYRHDTITPSDITYEQFYQLCIQRRSVRWYEQRPVEEDLIQKAIAAATLAPSACNRQPYRFEVINDSIKASEIASIAMGTKGFSENIPCLLVVIGNLSAYPFERDRHIIYIDATLAIMQLLLALETLSLSSCPINWPDIEHLEQVLAEKLKLDHNERPILLISVGYPDASGMIPWSQKKSVELLMGEKT